MDHRHVLLFDPLKIELEQVGTETVGNTVFKPGWRAFLIDAQNPAASLFADIGLCIRIAHHRVLGVARGAEFHQFWILLHDDELMLDGNGGHLDAKHLRGALRVVARRCHNMLGSDDDLLVRRHQIATLFDHFGGRHFPCLSCPVEGIGLPLALNHDSALPGALGHRHGDIGRVNVAICLMIERTPEVIRPDQRPLRLDLLRGHELIGHTAGLGG